MVINWSNFYWIIFVGILFSFGVLFRSQFRVLGLIFRLPGPFAVPIIGNVLNVVLHQKRFIQAVCESRETFGPIYRIWATVFPMVVVSEPQHIQKILMSSKHLDKSYIYTMAHDFVGEGLITIEVEKWRSHRKLMQPSFHVNFLHSTIDTFNNGSLYLIKSIESQIEGRCRSFNVVSLINKCVLNILCDVVLGIPIDEIVQENQHSSPFYQGSVNLQYRWYRPWLLINSLYKLTETGKKEVYDKKHSVKFLEKILEERKMRKGTQLTKTTYFDFLLEKTHDNEEFTQEDCIQEARTLMLAGQESVATAIAFCLHQLATHMSIQEKVFKELSSIFGSSERSPTFNDLKQMRYLEQCIKETLRLYPSVPFIARKLGEDVQVGKYTLPKGCEVLIAILITHRLPEYYPEPDIFNPDRFNQEFEKKHPCAYLPFSAGPRNCIGYHFAFLEMKTIISTILRKFLLYPVPGKSKLNIRYRLTLRNSGGVWINFTPRESRTPEDQKSINFNAKKNKLYFFKY